MKILRYVLMISLLTACAVFPYRDVFQDDLAGFEGFGFGDPSDRTDGAPRSRIPNGQNAVTALTMARDYNTFGGTSAFVNTLDGHSMGAWEGSCHVFYYNSARKLLGGASSLEKKIKGQRMLTGMVTHSDGTIFGATSNYVDSLYGTPKTRKLQGYAGGHLFSFRPEEYYDKSMDAVKDLGIPSAGEGIAAIAVDSVNQKVYGITEPSASLFVYHLKTGKFVDLEKSAFGRMKAPAMSV